MTKTIAAALKRIIEMLTNPDERKQVGKRIAAIFIIFFLLLLLPTLICTSVVSYFFSGETTEENWQTLVNALDDEHKEVLEKLEEEFEENDMLDRWNEAKVLTVFYLYDISIEPSFSFRIKVCFNGDPTTEELLEAVAEMFEIDTIDQENFEELVAMYYIEPPPKPEETTSTVTATTPETTTEPDPEVTTSPPPWSTSKPIDFWF